LFTYAEKINQNSKTDSSNSSWTGKTRINKKESEMNSIYQKNKIVIQPKLIINTPGDVYEQEADAMADKVMCMSITDKDNLKYDKEVEIQRKESSNNDDLSTAPPIVEEVINSTPGKPLDEKTRAFMEPRFGFDFSNVKIYDNDKAAESAGAINSLAYTTGNKIVFNHNQFDPESNNGQHLLAHELTHVIQQSDMVRPYRPSIAMDKTKDKRKSFNFGKLDDATLIEDSFDLKTDKETKPWIQLITIEFNTTKTDVNSSKYWEGTASVHYYDNPVKWSDYSFTVAGGSAELGKTDKGNFTVQRIEGVGYNSGSFSGRAGVDYDASNREGPRKRYSKDLSANMSYAVFYNGGEALHAGPIDESSHGCVHVDFTNIKQLNYHSVIGLTKVKVSYS